MSEFNFSCPACGHNILCDTARIGTEIVCPACNATVVVPPETAGLAQTGIAPTQKTSGLAVASLVCSLASLIMCIGWIPGIICGHIAKSRIRRDPSLKGNGLATAGLVIGYLFLMTEAGTTAVYVWRVSTAVKHGYRKCSAGFVHEQFHHPSSNHNRFQHQPTGAVRHTRDRGHEQSAR